MSIPPVCSATLEFSTRGRGRSTLFYGEAGISPQMRRRQEEMAGSSLQFYPDTGAESVLVVQAVHFFRHKDEEISAQQFPEG